ncbi:MAG: hypothetical protein WAV41_04815 [Microgenomates group bacterium]
MKKYFPYLILQILILISLFLVLPVLIIRDRLFVSIDTGQKLLPLISQHPYTRTIYNSPLGTKSIQLHLKNPSLKNNSRIFVDILDTQNIPLSQFVFSGSNIGDPSWINLDFTPLKNTDFQINIYTDNQNDQSLYIYTDNSSVPDFRSFYTTPSYLRRFTTNFNYQIHQATLRHPLHSILYCLLIIYLNITLFQSLYDRQTKK